MIYLYVTKKKWRLKIESKHSYYNDMNKLSDLRQKYYNEDNPPIHTKKNLVDKILNYFKL